MSPKILLCASTAAIALGVAAPAFAKDGDLVVGQVNVFTKQVGKTDFNWTSASSLNIVTGAIGNTASLDLAAGTSGEIAAFQLNGAKQEATTSTIGGISVGDALVQTQAVGNNLSAPGAGTLESVKALQVNIGGHQYATASLGGLGTNQAEVDTAAVGNNISLKAQQIEIESRHDGMAQINLFATQKAKTTMGGTFSNGDLTVNTQAIGNNISLTATKRNGDVNVDGKILQANVLSSQSATFSLADTQRNGGNLAVNTVAVGNVLNASALAGDITLDKGAKQLNLGSMQTASSTLTPWSTGVHGPGSQVKGKMNVTTAAVGNTISLATDSGWIGNDDHGRSALTQVNAVSKQDASTSVRGVTSIGDATIATQAIGNSVSLTGANIDRSPISQINIASTQNAYTVLGGNAGAGGAAPRSFGSTVTVSTVAVGNVANVTVK